jgi:hypothetical protein
MGVLALHVAAGGAAGGFEPGLGRGTVTRLEGLEAGVLEIAGLPEFDEGARAGGSAAFQFLGRIEAFLALGGIRGCRPPSNGPDPRTMFSSKYHS